VAADLFAGKIFRPINKADRVVGNAIANEKAIWQVVLKHVQAASLGGSHRTICAAPAPNSAAKRAGSWNRFSFCWATLPFRQQTLGTEQNLAPAVNGAIDLQMD
jgi:hypothetical protein